MSQGINWSTSCLLYTSDAADEEDSVDLGGRRIIKKDPSGYLWMHRRFKSGQAESLYPKWTSREKRREKRRMNRNKD